MQRRHILTGAGCALALAATHRNALAHHGWSSFDQNRPIYLAGKVKASLDKTLKLAPKHAEAHSALGIYHAEIINKVGAMIGGLTYGAKASIGEDMLNKAIKLDPKSPIAQVELANGLSLLYGDKREDDAAEAYDKAAKLKPRDAMEKLDAEFAKAQLE